jgi:hypothetical protein
MAIKCLGSLVDMSTEAIHLTAHDDGTLTPKEVEILNQRIPLIQFVERRFADEWADSFLNSWPNCQRLRRHHVLAPKLFDIFMFDEENEITFCDSDVLFFRPFHGLQTCLGDSDAVFMRDIVNQLAYRSWDIFRHRIQLVSHLNSGLFSVRRSILDLDKLEWLLQFEYPALLKHFAEQTAWAVICSTRKTSFWNPEQIRIAHPSTHLNNATIGFHYVGHYRNRLGSDAVDSANAVPSTALGTVESESIGFLGACRSEAERMCRRLLGLNPYPSTPYRHYGV